MKLVSRLLPEITGEDKYRGLLAAQDYLLSLGVTGWQDAIVGPGYASIDDTTDAYLRAASAGTLIAERCRGAVVAAGPGTGAARGAAPLPPAQRGRAIQADQREDDARRDRGEPHRRDARVLPRPRRLRDRELRAGLHRPRRAPPLRDRPRPGGLPGALPRARRPGGPQRAQRRRGCPRGPPRQRQGHLDPAPSRAPASRPPRRHPPVRRARRDSEPADAVGDERAADDRADDSLPRRHAGHLAVPVRRVRRLGRASGRRQRLAREQPGPAPRRPRGGQPRAAGDRRRSLPAAPGDHPAEALAAYTSGAARINGVAASAGSIKAGYDASLAVTDADLATIPDAEICRASVTQTWVRGELA